MGQVENRDTNSSDAAQMWALAALFLLGPAWVEDVQRDYMNRPQARALSLVHESRGQVP